MQGETGSRDIIRISSGYVATGARPISAVSVASNGPGPVMKITGGAVGSEGRGKRVGDVLLGRSEHVDITRKYLCLACIYISRWLRTERVQSPISRIPPHPPATSPGQDAISIPEIPGHWRPAAQLSPTRSNPPPFAPRLVRADAAVASHLDSARLALPHGGSNFSAHFLHLLLPSYAMQTRLSTISG
jgi:hypothetical protein